MGLLRLDPASAVPPFEQIRTAIAGQVAEGKLPAGAKLPTVRGLATDLDVAAGTVARAYRELEGDGVIVTHGRRGTFVTSLVVEQGSGSAAGQAAGRAATDYVRIARRLGLTVAEATQFVEGAWHSDQP